MPRKAINYQSTVIYKIVCDDLMVKYCYVGSTTDFTKRKCRHKTACNNEKGKEYNYKVYTTIRDNGGWDNWSMVMIEEYPCENSQQAVQRERFWYEELNADLNMVRPHRTEEELTDYKKDYYQANIEKYKESHKEYREANREKMKEYKKKWRENNREKRKEYYQANKDKLKENQKEYREANRDRINKQQRERRALKKQLSAQIINELESIC
jgi:hypothetical protein